MVLELPALHLFVYQPRLCETKFDLFSDRLGETFLVDADIQKVLPISFGGARGEGDLDGVAHLLIEIELVGGPRGALVRFEVADV